MNGRALLGGGGSGVGVTHIDTCIHKKDGSSRWSSPRDEEGRVSRQRQIPEINIHALW